MTKVVVRFCLECGAKCPAKKPSAPGPAPKYCGRKCSMRAAQRRLNTRRRQGPNPLDVIPNALLVRLTHAELTELGLTDAEER